MERRGTGVASPPLHDLTTPHKAVPWCHPGRSWRTYGSSEVSCYVPGTPSPLTPLPPLERGTLGGAQSAGS